MAKKFVLRTDRFPDERTDIVAIHRNATPKRFKGPPWKLTNHGAVVEKCKF